MVKYCLDTNILIDYLRGDELVIKKLKSLILTGNVFITPITLCELYQGAYSHSNSERKVFHVGILASGFDILDFDEEPCKEFGRIYAKLKKKGNPIPEFDLMIASIVKVNDLTLVTRDKKHFENTGVEVEVW